MSAKTETTAEPPTPYAIHHSAPEVREIIKLLDKHMEPRVISVTPPKFDDAETIPVMLIPENLKPYDYRPLVEAYRGRPDRRKGTAQVQDTASFIAHVIRHKDPFSVIFANPERGAPKLTAIFNYNMDGGEASSLHPIDVKSRARFGDHRTVYAPKLSEEYQAWSAVNGKPLDQAEFAEFIETRVMDLCEPPDFDGEEGAHNAYLKQFTDLVGGKFASPSRMMGLARGVKINAENKVTAIVNLATGEGRMNFSEEHRDGDGAPITIPNLFLIVIPVFYNGTPYRIPVRLRYRLRGGSVAWSFEIYRIDRTFDAAFDGIRATVEAETELDVFLGSPEG
jgi:hypothetical protein